MKIYISKEKHKDEYVKDKEYYKVRDYCHYTSKYNVAAHSICNLKSSIPKEILIVLHDELNYGFHFIM